MSTCLPGREVTLALRRNRAEDARLVRVVCPHRWSKSTLLRYVREEHPRETARIVEWPGIGEVEDPWKVRLWIANPQGFEDYVRGRPSNGGGTR